MTSPVHQLQLNSVPVANEAVVRTPVAADKLQLSIPLNQPMWTKAARLLLPMSKEKNVELDRLGSDIFALCDGAHTVEQIIDTHKDRWHLSFFEARAMILQFLQHLMRHKIIVLIAPAEDKG